ncbi:hypothetical protein GCM10023191_067070 [Actinoallomurus oryzae]|uniref:Nitroreductase domain-containing protein n=1 Tax=Actinoallomurus oryzae TaxID=502180 RepID=A0ABP8QU34_9ACTN
MLRRYPIRGLGSRPAGIHPLLAGRFSPYKFDPSATIDDHSLGLLLEAARWAPSAGNSQP